MIVASSWFSLMDLFVVGIAFDLVGAVLLGRSVIARLTFNYVALPNNLDPNEAVERVNNEIDGWMGVGSLVVGFCIQAVGYFRLIDGWNAGTGSRQAVGSALLALLVIAVVAVLRIFLHWPIMRRRLAHYSKWQWRTRNWAGEPYLPFLALAARAAGKPPPRNETRREWVARLFGVDLHDDESMDAEATRTWLDSITKKVP